MGCAGVGDKLLGKWNKLRLVVAVFGRGGDIRAPKVKFARWLRCRRGSKRSLRPTVFINVYKSDRGGCTFNWERDTVALPLFPSLLLLLLLGWRRGLLDDELAISFYERNEKMFPLPGNQLQQDPLQEKVFLRKLLSLC
jgi:hypothetical protein